MASTADEIQRILGIDETPLGGALSLNGFHLWWSSPRDIFRL